MVNLKQMVQGLKRAIRQEGKVRVFYWPNKLVYSDLFKSDSRGLGDIDVKKLSHLLIDVKEPHGALFISATTVNDAEKAICDAYRDYKTLGFWSRFWLRLTQPRIGLYAQLYTLIKLRNYRNTYTSIVEGTLGKQSIFNTLLTTLTDYFRSNLPSHDFFTRWFNKPLRFLDHGMKNQLHLLKGAMETEFQEFLYALAAAQDANKLEQEMERVLDWMKETFQSLNGIVAHEEKKLFNTMCNVLHEFMAFKKDAKMNPSLVTRATKNYIRQSLTQGLMQLKEGCVVYINPPSMPKKPFTYLLKKDKNDWLLTYKVKDKVTIRININEVKNLKQLLEAEVLDETAIKQALYTYHKNDADIQYQLDPVNYYKFLLDQPMPWQQAKTLIHSYSLDLLKNEAAGQSIMLKKLFCNIGFVIICRINYQKEHTDLLKERERESNDFKAAISILHKMFSAFPYNAIWDSLFRLRLEGSLKTKIKIEDYLSTVINDHLKLDDFEKSVEYNMLNDIAKKQTIHRYNRNKKIAEYRIQIMKKITLYQPGISDGFIDIFSVQRSPWYNEILQLFQDSNVLSKAALIELSAKYMTNRIKKIPYQVDALKLAFAEILEEINNHLTKPKFTKTPKPALITYHSSSTTSLTQMPSNASSQAIPMPTEETEEAWDAWLSENMKSPQKLTLAVGNFKEKLVTAKRDSKKDLLHYTVLIQLLLIWVQAARWLTIDISQQETYLQAKQILDLIYKLFSLYYHPDKNQSADAQEVMSKLNAAHDIGNEQLEQAMTFNQQAPEWINNRMGSHAVVQSGLKKEIDALIVHREEMIKHRAEMAESLREINSDQKEIKNEQEKIKKDLENIRKIAEGHLMTLESIGEENKTSDENMTVFSYM